MQANWQPDWTQQNEAQTNKQEKESKVRNPKKHWRSDRGGADLGGYMWWMAD